MADKIEKRILIVIVTFLAVACSVLGAHYISSPPTSSPTPISSPSPTFISTPTPIPMSTATPAPTPFGWHLMLRRVFLWENGMQLFVAGIDSDLCNYLFQTVHDLNSQLKCCFSEEHIQEIKTNDEVLELSFRFYENITIAQWIEPQDRSHIETNEDGYRILRKVQCVLFVLEDNLNEGLEAHILVYSLIDGWSGWAIQRNGELDKTWISKLNELLRKELTFKPYISAFHLMFEDALSHSILANLTGETSIVEVDKNFLHATCKLAFTAHESVERIEMDIGFMPFIFYEGPIPVTWPGSIRRIFLLNGEKIILAEGTFNVSMFNEPMVAFGFSSGHTKTVPEDEEYGFPRISLQFSDGSLWKWEYNYNNTPQFTFWSGFRHWKLTELSGKTDRSSYTIFLYKPTPTPTPTTPPLETPPVAPNKKYLCFRGGEETKVFLIDSHLYYGGYEESFDRPGCDPFCSIGREDPRVIINGTIRNDYDKDYFISLTADIYNVYGEKVGLVVDSPAPFPGFSVAFVESSSEASFKIHIKYDNRDITRYDIFLAFQPSENPPP